MAVPGYQKFMHPILRLAADGAEHVFSDAIEQVCNTLGLTEGDQQVMLPSGTQSQVYNRFSWAVTYLQKSGLLAKTGRGRFRISDSGRQVLAENLPAITNEYLMQFPGFVEFKTPSRGDPDAGTDAEESCSGTSVATPEERLQAAHREMTDSLASELLEKIMVASPRFFEYLVVDLLVKMGYGGSHSDAAQVVGKAGDGGIDGTIKEDKLGLDTIYIQAKRWEGCVGRKEIQAFAGSLEGERATKGVFITTSSFTSEALEYAKRIGRRIVLLDGDRLTRLMIEHNVGCNEQHTYSLKRVDNDCFEEL